MSTPVDYQPVSVGNRIIGAIIDFFVVLVPFLVVWAILRQIDDRLAVIAGTLVYAVYETVMYSKSGKTVGKGVVHARVTSDPATMAKPTAAQSLIRSLARSGAPFQILSAFISVFGFISLLWALALIITTLADPKKRGLHDKIAGTYIVSTDTAPVSAAGTYVPPTDEAPPFR